MAGLDGKVVLLTGGAQGMGAAEAKGLVTAGATLVIADVLDEKGQSLAGELGDTASYQHLDVRRKADWANAVDHILERFGRLDALINNAGILRVGPLLEADSETFHQLNEVNVLGPLLGIQAVAPAMLEAGTGSIVNVASINGLMGSPGLSLYAATKHAVLGLTRSAAMELAASGVRVNAVCPGCIHTPMIADAIPQVEGIDPVDVVKNKIPAARLGDPQELAGMMVYLVSDDSSFCNGSIFSVDGGLSAGYSLFS